MIKALTSKRGEGYIDTAISFLAIMIVVALALNIFSFLTLKMDMDYFAREMVDVATTFGVTSGSQINSRYNDLKADTGISPTVTWEAIYFDGSKVQYGNPIRVTLIYNSYIAGTGAVHIPITVKTSYSGLSQQYWK